MQSKLFIGITLEFVLCGTGCLEVPEEGVTEEEYQALLAQVESMSAEMDQRLTTLEESSIRLITEDATLTVGPSSGVYADLPSALSALDRYRIATGVTVTLQLEQGTFIFDEALAIQHPDGDRIAILGDLADPSTTVLAFDGTDGIRVLQNHALGRLDGVTLVQLQPGVGTGVAVETGSSVIIGDRTTVNVVLRNWYSGLAATVGASLIADGGVIVEDCTNGIEAGYNSVVQASSAIVSSSAVKGLEAIYGSVLLASQADLEATYYGVYSVYGSMIYVPNTKISSPDRALLADQASALFADNTTVTDGGIYVAWNSMFAMSDCALAGDGIWVRGDSFAYVGGCSNLGDVVLEEDTSQVVGP